MPLQRPQSDQILMKETRSGESLALRSLRRMSDGAKPVDTMGPDMVDAREANVSVFSVYISGRLRVTDFVRVLDWEECIPGAPIPI